MKFKAEEEIRKVVDPIAEEQGLKVCSVEFKNTDDPSITVFIDKEGGVDLDACERFHNAIDAPLDELDPSFGESYTLNVSSLGADRHRRGLPKPSQYQGGSTAEYLRQGQKVFRRRARLFRRKHHPRESKSERYAYV